MCVYMYIYQWCVQRFFGETDVSRGFGGGREAVMPPYGFKAKHWWGPGGKAPGRSRDLLR